MRKFILFVLFFSVSLFIFLLKENSVTPAVGNVGYAGTETCKGCHDPYVAGYVRSVHGKRAIPNSPASREGCESCHGPGAEHAEKGGGKGVAIFAFDKKKDARAKNNNCLTCHEVLRPLASWSMSRHKSADIACVDCHSIHGEGHRKGLLRQREPDLCFTCHKNIRAQTNRQSRHPIQEGRMKCNDCHNPHGSFDSKAMLKADSVNELCYTCHAEKRGPYPFEHPPVPENCLSCHNVHGSNHSNLLTRRVPLLCQSCHNVEGHPIRPYNNLHSFGGSAVSQKNRFFARSCLNCHGNIHGSSHPALGHTFVR